MEISVLDFVLINGLSYMFGVITGLLVCCKNKDTLLSRSRSNDTITNSNYNHQQTMYPTEQNVMTTIQPSAPYAPAYPVTPPKQSLKITME